MHTKSVWRGMFKYLFFALDCKTEMARPGGGGAEISNYFLFLGLCWRDCKVQLGTISWTT